jgi:16S rRNA (adenine1518-N6/adenine1519-N6)-dimethyltransferase
MPGRRLGQHFLVRKPILERIADAAAPVPEDTHVEIGPGKGALTEFLVTRAARVVAIEVDQVLVHYLQHRFRDASNLTVLHNDVLQTDLRQWGRVGVVGNLPYYITSPIIDKVLALGPLLVRATFLVQREVAERITAGPGSRDYGYLSVQCQVRTEAKMLFTVAPGSFSPPPKVDSAVIQLTPRPELLVDDYESFMKFVSAAFRQKRKNLRNNLSAAYPKAAVDALPEGNLRAEQMSIVQLRDAWQRILKG